MSQTKAIMKLEVGKLFGEDIFKDRVRIPLKYRQGIPEGQICKISTVTKKKIVQVSGKKSEPNTAMIYMDGQTRKFFHLQPGMTADFTIQPVGWLGQLQWASKHADPGLRIAAQLGIISLLLGSLSVLIAILGLPWSSWISVIIN